MFSGVLSGCPCVRCPSVNTYLACALGERISVSLDTNFHHVTGNC